jgi:hypothetical protein
LDEEGGFTYTGMGEYGAERSRGEDVFRLEPQISEGVTKDEFLF